MKIEKELKEEILKEVKKYGQEDAKRILGKGLPKDFINEFLDEKSLFYNILNKTIDFTITKRNAEVKQAIEERIIELEISKKEMNIMGIDGEVIKILLKNYKELLQKWRLGERK